MHFDVNQGEPVVFRGGPQDGLVLRLMYSPSKPNDVTCTIQEPKAYYVRTDERDEERGGWIWQHTTDPAVIATSPFASL